MAVAHYVTWRGRGPWAVGSRRWASGALSAGAGYFMLFNTSSGLAEEAALLESRILYPKRKQQCLQFFYKMTGSPSDRLVVWVRRDDSTGNVRKLVKVETFQGTWRRSSRTRLAYNLGSWFFFPSLPPFHPSCPFFISSPFPFSFSSSSLFLHPPKCPAQRLAYSNHAMNVLTTQKLEAAVRG